MIVRKLMFLSLAIALNNAVESMQNMSTCNLNQCKEVRDFIRAIIDNRLCCVQRLLKENKENINKKSQKFGWTPLHYTAYLKFTELAKFFLQNQASPNIKDNDGNTPLHRAAVVGSLDVAQLLLGHEIQFSNLVDLYCKKDDINAFRTFLLCLKRKFKERKLPKPIIKIIFECAFIHGHLQELRRAANTKNKNGEEPSRKTENPELKQMLQLYETDK